MLNLFRAKGRSGPTGRIPDGLRVYAIGDVHGHLDLLETLLATIAEDATARPDGETHLVLLGDLIDRGPQSAQVVEYVRQRSEADPRLHLIMGNHEEMMLRALVDEDPDASAMRLFYRNGGHETLLSYGLTDHQCSDATFEEVRLLARDVVPESHLLLLRGMKDHVAFGDYLFVHAGIRPGLPIEEQRGSDLRWIRSEFLNDRTPHGAIVVHGHSISQAVDLQSNRIGIDTGAFRSGKLTAIGLQGSERWFLST